MSELDLEVIKRVKENTAAIALGLSVGALTTDDVLAVVDAYESKVGEVEELRAELAKAQAATTAALGDVHAELDLEAIKRRQPIHSTMLPRIPLTVVERDALVGEVEELRAELDKARYEIMGYQVAGPYEVGHEHGVRTAIKHVDRARAVLGRIASDESERRGRAVLSESESENP